ncbi:multiple epidermal growth factor-like domains protein 6 [Mustela nigripes]|uniref:multiple epidermal growth factor-like domains protein 6 n=1 Tax=Mustela nigripes TaxID=77151 RepID=UPI002815508A|nr:multiple epidermal growth factor-like domains protein 6 [Mustela nigripes]
MLQPGQAKDPAHSLAPGFPCHCSSMLHPGLWMALAPLLGTLSAGHICQDGTVAIPCPAGSFKRKKETSHSNTSFSSEVGHYCPLGTKEPTQFQCPPGTWSSQTGLTAVEECAPCPRGWFCSGGAQLPSGTCKAGHYCPQGTMWGTQFPCPAGTYSSQAGNGQVEDCLLCPPGAFCPSGAPKPMLCPRMLLSMASECLSCPPGHFCGASGLTAPSGPCSPGYFCLERASSPIPAGHSHQGGPCPRGHFCPSGTSHPQPCPPGSYSNLTGQASCFPCPAGYYCPENITTYSGHPCPAGFYCPRGTKYATQYPCPRGYYNPDPLTQSLDSCLPCPPGHYCGQENLTQASGPCDAGWFCVSAAWTSRPFDLDNYTSTNCLCPATATGGKCPSGSFCPEGTPEPIPCLPGSFCATSGLSTPSGPCQAGYFCAEGAVSPAPEDGLTGAPCPPGTFCPAASHRPTPCPVGTFSSLPEQTMPSACQVCPRSFYCKEAGLQAPSGQCPAGERQ